MKATQLKEANSGKFLIGKRDNEILIFNKNELFDLVELQRLDRKAKREYSIFKGGKKLRNEDYSKEVKLADGRIRVTYDVSGYPNRNMIVYEDGRRRLFGGRYKIKKSLEDGKWKM